MYVHVLTAFQALRDANTDINAYPNLNWQIKTENGFCNNRSTINANSTLFKMVCQSTPHSATNKHVNT